MQSPRYKTTIPVCLVLLLFAATMHADMSPNDKKPAWKKGWHTNFSQAQAEAKSLGKPLLIHFYADWCGPCKQMERTVLNQPQVVSRLGRDVVGVKVNADHHPRLRSRFGVSGYPSDVMLSPDGDVSTRYVGATSKSRFIARLEREGDKYPSQPKEKLAKKSEPKATKKTPSNNPEQDETDAERLGLEGFSPVALATGQLWKKGDSRFAAIYRGIEYHFTDEKELQAFLDSPSDYAPRHLGCDPVILAESGRAVRGKITQGVVYGDHIYLMATEANRKQFLEKPEFFAKKRFAVEADQIEQYVSR